MVANWFILSLNEDFSMSINKFKGTSTEKDVGLDRTDIWLVKLESWHTSAKPHQSSGMAFCLAIYSQTEIGCSVMVREGSCFSYFAVLLLEIIKNSDVLTRWQLWKQKPNKSLLFSGKQPHVWIIRDLNRYFGSIFIRVLWMRLRKLSLLYIHQKTKQKNPRHYPFTESSTFLF